MKTQRLFQLFWMSIVIGLLSACAATKVTEPDFSGEWHYTFPTMEGGEMAAVMNLNKENGTYAGYLSSEMGSVGLDNLVIEGNNLKASITIESYTLDITGSFEGDAFHGKTLAGGMEIPMEAVRK